MPLVDVLANLGALGQGYVKTQDELAKTRQREMLANLEALNFQRLNQQFQQQQGAGNLAGMSLPDAMAGLPQLSRQAAPPQPTPMQQPAPIAPPPRQQASTGGDQLAPNLAGSNVNWQQENPVFQQRVSDMLASAPQNVREASSVDSGYRTNQEQADIYQRSGQGSKFMAAPPGKSLHEQGLAADWSFKNPEASQWFHQNAKQFGLDFPLGPRDPNHMQLVANQQIGQTAVAQAQSGVPVPLAKGAADVSRQSLSAVDPADYGRATLDSIYKAVEKNGANASPMERLLAVQQLQKLMLPEDQMMMKAFMAQNQQLFRAGMTEYVQDQINKRAGDRQDTQGWQIIQDQGKTYRVKPATGEMQEISLSGAAHKVGTEPRSAPGMALRTFMEDFQQREGHPPGSDDIRNFMAQQAETLSEARSIGGGAASLERASNAADALVPLVREKSRQINRTNYPDVNSLILAYETKTGDPNVVQYGEMVNSLRYLYARAVAPSGQGPRVADINHFDEIFNKAWSAGQVDSALDQIQRAITVEKGAIDKTKANILGKPQAAPDYSTMDANQLRSVLVPERWQQLTPDQQKAVESRIQQLEGQRGGSQ